MAMERAVEDISYENFNDSVKDHTLHLAYARVWSTMAGLQNPRPYSTGFTAEKELTR